MDALKSDVMQARKRFRHVEENIGIPCVDLQALSASQTSIILNFDLAEVPEAIRNSYEIDDIAYVSIHLGQFDRTTFRQSPPVSLYILASKQVDEASTFIAGEQLKNYTLGIIDKSFQLSNGAEDVPENESFFAFLYEKLAKRLQSLSDFCISCNAPLSRDGSTPSICGKGALCSSKESGMVALLPRASPDVLALLIYLSRAANLAYNRYLVLTGIPPILLSNQEALDKERERVVAKAESKSAVEKALKEKKNRDSVGEDNEDAEERFNRMLNQMSITPYLGKHTKPAAEKIKYVASRYRKAIMKEAATESWANPNHLPELFLLEEALALIECPRALLSSPSKYRAFSKEFPKTAQWVEWLVSSTQSSIYRVPQALLLPFVHTSQQYVCAADSPSKQARFENLKEAYGGNTVFLFHGSPLSNWHSILRNGLRNMTRTPLSSTEFFGSGIYLTPSFLEAFEYTLRHPVVYEARPELVCCKDECCVGRPQLPTNCDYSVGIIEVIDDPEILTRTSVENILLLTNEDYCCVRMLLLFDQEAADSFKYQCKSNSEMGTLGADQAPQIAQLVDRVKNLTFAEKAEFGML